MNHLELRKKIKKTKPVFLRQEANKKNKLSHKWRKPKGIHSKLRHGIKGHGKKVRPGYGAPSDVQHLHHTGKNIKNIYCLTDLTGLDPNASCISIGAGVGGRKRLAIVQEAQKRNIIIINFKDISLFLKKTEEEMKKRREERKNRKSKKEEKKEDKKKAKNIEEKLSIEEKKEKEKKELDKALITREQ